MRRLALWLMFIFIAPYAAAQGFRYAGQISDQYGRPVPSPTILVCGPEPVTGTPCTPVVQIYSDVGLTQPLTNPYSGDQYGQFSFFAAAGTYHVQVSGTGVLATDIPYINLGIGTGSLTSVALVAPSGFSVSGSPVTGAGGTLTLAMPTGWIAGSLLVGTGTNTVGQLGIGANLSCLTSNGATPSWTTSCGFYQTVEANGTALTQRYTLNFISGSNITVGCVDNSGATRTDCTFSTSSPTLYYQTVEANGTAQTQRPTVNLIQGTNMTVGCVDNSGSSRTDCTISAASGTVTGSGTANTFPLWTATSVIGNSSLTAVTSPIGINYSVGSGIYWQLDASHLTWNSGISGSNNIVVANTYNPGPGVNSGGIIIQAAPTSGSACAGNAIIDGGAISSTNASISANGECENGFGLIGAGVVLTSGTGTGGNGNGVIELNDNIGTFLQSSGNGIESGFINAQSGLEQNGTALGIFCGTTTACSATAKPLTHFVFGTVALSSASPSTAVVTGIAPAFTSTSTYNCTVTNETTAADGLKVANTSSSSITITGPNTVTDTVSYICVGT
jgi:hypothetical protein